MLTGRQVTPSYGCDTKRYFNQSKCSQSCKGLSKHEKGLSEHEKGLSKHEKGLSDLNHSKMYRQFITKGSKVSYAYLDSYAYLVSQAYL